MCGENGGWSGDSSSSRDPSSNTGGFSTRADRDSRGSGGGGATGSRSGLGGVNRTGNVYRPIPVAPTNNSGNQIVTPAPVVPTAPVVTPPAPVVTPPPAAPVDTSAQELAAAYNRGIGGANSFFQSRGVDPAAYLSQITAGANARRAGAAGRPSGTDFDSYFADLGKSIYDQETTGLRNRSMQGVESYTPTGFENTRIRDTSDDALIDMILDEQYNPAQDYVNRLFNRGTITDQGLDAALAELGSQLGEANADFQGVGSGILNEGRAGARGVATSGRNRASVADLANGFDTKAFGDEVNNYFRDFFGGLEGKLRAGGPTDVFDTEQLSRLAGAPTGAGGGPIFGTPQGPIDEEDEEEEETRGGAF